MSTELSFSATHYGNKHFYFSFSWEQMSFVYIFAKKYFLVSNYVVMLRQVYQKSAKIGLFLTISVVVWISLHSISDTVIFRVRFQFIWNLLFIFFHRKDKLFTYFDSNVFHQNQSGYKQAGRTPTECVKAWLLGHFVLRLFLRRKSIWNTSLKWNDQLILFASIWYKFSRK